MTESIISKKEPEKSLLVNLKKTGGRNIRGRITVRHRGGGMRKIWRAIDFGQEHLGRKGKVKAIEYDPNRNAFIALVEYEGGGKAYVLAAQGMEEGTEILCDEQTSLNAGNRMRLKYIPIGTLVHNIELEPGKGGKLVRSAGSGAKVLAAEGRYAQLELPSKEIRKVLQDCFASVGMVSNPGHKDEVIGKAGRMRWKGRRPKVRGTAMNPRDHPHGGGEGRTGRGMKHPKTPWGKPALGVKTRRKKWTDKFILERRKK